MRLLIDTCTFLWFIASDPKLTDAATQAIADPDNDVLLSIASGWEIALKYQAGKLELDAPPEVLVPQQMAVNQIQPLSIDLDHVLKTASLPRHHRDPFDRLLAVQCLAEDLPIVSSDVIFDAYGVRRIW